MRLLSLGPLLLLAACASSPPTPITRVVRRDTLLIAAPGMGVGELTPDQVRALAPRVRAIQLEQGATTIAPGDTFSIFRFPIRLLDSTGATLGRTRIYDFGMKEGAAAMQPPPIVRGIRAGESQMHISFARRMWVGRSDPPAETFLRITVRPRPPRRVGEGGFTMLTGRVRADYGAEITVPDSGPRQTRLRFIVLWRAQPEWCRRPCSRGDGTDPDSMQARQREAEARGNRFAGSAGGGLVYGVEIDDRRSLLTVLDQTARFGIPDSATVVLVDRIDEVGGPPTVVRIFRIPALIATDSIAAPRESSLSRMQVTTPALLDALRRAPVARAFIDAPPPRIPSSPAPGRRAD
jgi:hypothetical protein